MFLLWLIPFIISILLMLLLHNCIDYLTDERIQLPIWSWILLLMGALLPYINLFLAVALFGVMIVGLSTGDFYLPKSKITNFLNKKW